MRNSFLIVAIISILTGCGLGDRMEFSTRGHAFLKGPDIVCLKSLPNDVLKYYLVSSSEDHYKTVLLVENHINKIYPNTCINIKLKKNVSYDIMYIMNDEKLSVGFTLGNYNDLIEEK